MQSASGTEHLVRVTMNRLQLCQWSLDSLVAGGLLGLGEPLHCALPCSALEIFLPPPPLPPWCCAGAAGAGGGPHAGDGGGLGRWHFSSVRLYNHFRGSAEGNYRCDPCAKFFKNVSSWRQHQYYQHRSHRRFPCEYCGKSFTTKWYQGQHIQNVHRPQQNKGGPGGAQQE